MTEKEDQVHVTIIEFIETSTFMTNFFGPNNKTIKQSTMKSYGIVFLIIIAFFGGWYVGKGRTLGDGSEGATTVKNKGVASSFYTTAPDFRMFWDVWEDVKRDFVNQPVNEVDLYYGAMEGMIAALDDPYSSFFDPELAAAFDEELSGAFSGIGVEIGIKNDVLVIIAPLDGSPGYLAGLKAGDIVVAIDDTDTFRMPLDVAVSMIRGEQGTPVRLTVLSKNDDETHVVTIIRDTIEHTGLRWEYINTASGQKIAHIKLSSFDVEAESLLNQLIREIETQNDIDGIILDLRNNPGGFLDMAIEVASEWVEDGIIVREKDNNGDARQHNARGRARLKGYRTVVLVNEGSASASEIVAGALQDYGLATLVGETTFGKGSVQKYEVLEDGSSYRLTIAHWFTPEGRAINEVGIPPDISIEMGEDDFDNDKDSQLDRALEVLRGN